MQRLEVSGAVRPIYGSLGVKRLKGEEIQIRISLTLNIKLIGCPETSVRNCHRTLRNVA